MLAEISGYQIIEDKFLTRKALVPMRILSRKRRWRGLTGKRMMDIPDDQNCYIDKSRHVIYAHPLFIIKLEYAIMTGNLNRPDFLKGK